MSLPDPDAFLRSLFDAAVGAAMPSVCLPPHLPAPPRGRTVVVGAGKAAAAMAATVEEHWSERLDGLVVTRYGHGVPCRDVEVVEASHPVPDAAGQAAAERILRSVQGLTEDDLVLCLISGGGSALLALPAPGVTLDDKRAVNKALLASGATIAEINTVRKHLSAVKGGRLAAAAAPARVLTLAISDVPGDDPAVIASGPTVADPTTARDALDVLRRYEITEPPAVIRALEDGEETPKPGDPRLARSEVRLVATAQDALEAAAERARDAGVTPLVLGDAIEGEAREVGRVLAGIARQVARWGQPVEAPAVLLSGGETTVSVRRTGGRGGRNTELLLGLALALDGAPGIHALAGDTDGIDGTETNAGAVVRPDTLARARRAGLSAAEHLARHDAYGFFEALGDLVVTGPTRTNVNDFRAVFVQDPG